MKKANHLIKEKSPYLLQHAHNPVDWHPWGEEAFQKARKENKPLLVSIGYSTCHWCHVMERESFSDPGIARIMNETLVCVKVDREERPDVDKIYMTAVTAMTGQGGWPLNVFLTPDLKPFFGGTYFPPENRWGRIGWPQLVERIGKSWSDPEEHGKIVDSAQNLTDHLADVLTAERPSQDFDAAILGRAYEAYRAGYDDRLGGFGGAPKFPMPVTHHFLLRYYDFERGRNPASKDAENALKMSLQTLRAMARGGICDQIGGGFHRYSTDEFWHVPHFEKMLYDNAQLAINYLEAYQITKDPLFERVARETLDYVLRDMTHPDGGFYSAEDADSLPPELAGKVSNEGHEHKAEGAFYVWSKKEILEALGKESGEVFSYHSGVLEEGNARSDPQEEFKGKNVLYNAYTLEETAKKFGKSGTEISRILSDGRQKLFVARVRRPRPHLDDKILASWNGLMISAYAKAAAILNEPRYLAAAKRSAGFALTRLYVPKDRRLYRRWRDGERSVPGISDDYAFMAQGLLDLHEASNEMSWLETAIELSEEALDRFYDPKTGGFYMTEPGHDAHLLLRIKEDTDNVEPCASSVMVLNLLRLSAFADRKDFREAAEKTLKFFSKQMREFPSALPHLAAGAALALGKTREIVLVGDASQGSMQEMLKEARFRFMPNQVLIVIDGEESRKKWARLQPFLEGLKPIGGKPTAYVCVDKACELPTTDLEVLKKILSDAEK